MPPRLVKPDPEVESHGSPGLSTIQPASGNTTSEGTDNTPGLRPPGFPTSHSLPVIHETEESYFNSQFPGLGGTALGPQPYPLSYPGNTSINSFGNAFQDPSVFDQMYLTGNNNMNTMSRNALPSSRIARNQGLGSSGTGPGAARRPSHQHGRTGIATNQAVTRAALGMAANPGQASNQGQFASVDLTAMDYPIGSPSSMGFYGSTLNSGMDPNFFASSTYNPLQGTSGGVQQTSQGQGSRNTSPVPKFDPELHSPSPEFISPSQYESFGEDEHDTKPNPRSIPAVGTPTRPPRNQQTSMAMANVSPATADVSSPGDSPFDASSGGGGSSGTRPAQPPPYQAHVPPNRIAEAGPVTHPDPEWRPYGTNHWHVFLREPTLLKYLSSTEIKDIREHCYEMASKGAGDGGDDEHEQAASRPVAEGSPYTAADAQAVWKHCDAYIRRRSQVRNNQAARRSRQRKDAETRYWRALALQYGAPDHEFDWGLVDDDGNLPAHVGGGPSTPASRGGGGAEGGGAGQQTRARTRTQARAQQQQQQGGGGEGQAQGQGGGQQGQQATANRRASAPSGAAARPDFDFNQPLDPDEDDKTRSGNFDPFTGDY